MDNSIKAKGEELIEKFRKHSFPSNDEYDTTQCAIIAVEEIIRVVQHENQLDHYNQVLLYLKSKV